jgi:hypothetical protein
LRVLGLDVLNHQSVWTSGISVTNKWCTACAKGSGVLPWSLYAGQFPWTQIPCTSLFDYRQVSLLGGEQYFHVRLIVVRSKLPWMFFMHQWHFEKHQKPIYWVSYNLF